MSILEACKPSLDPSKRFNTSFSIGILILFPLNF